MKINLCIYVLIIKDSLYNLNKFGDELQSD